MDNVDNTVEKDDVEHDQSHVYAMKIKDMGWVDVVPGTLELNVGSMEEVFTGGVFYTVKTVMGAELSGVLLDVIGLKSFKVDEPVTEDE